LDYHFFNIGKRCTILQRLYDYSKEETAVGPQQGGPAPGLAKNNTDQRQAEVQQQLSKLYMSISVIFSNNYFQILCLHEAKIHMTELHAFLLVEMILRQEPVDDCYSSV